MTRRRALRRLSTFGLAAALVVGVRSPDASSSARPVYPDAIVVMGHSGATGYDSNPLLRYSDAPENSWVTGTNPAVNSIYRRILARNPAIKGHALNVARSGSDVTDLIRQARIAVASRPTPELFVIQSVDNDIRCDGTDARNNAPFAATLRRTLEFINRRAPKAPIFVVGYWATVQNYAKTIASIPAKRAAESGNQLCSVLDPSGRLRPAGMASLRRIVDAYHARIAATCARVSNCRSDKGALQRLTLVRRDLSPDANHLSIQGLRKMAAIAWEALY